MSQQVPTSTSSGSMPTELHKGTSDSYYTSANSREGMEQNLCNFCRVIPFREGEYAAKNGNGIYRTEEQYGEMRLFWKNSPTGGWIPSPYTENVVDVGYKRTDTVPELPSITASAETGCGFCEFILATSLKDKCIETCKKSPDVSTISIHLYYRLLVFHKLFLSELLLEAHFGRGGVLDVETGSYSAKYTALAKEHDPFAKLLDTQKLPPAIPPDRRLPTIREWITNCDCDPQRSNENIPTRLLEVASEDKIHLIDCKGKKKLPEWKYVALSHCWGSPDRPPIKTTEASLDERSRHIPFDDLPRNYQDAVRVTRGLGLKYLWIDSLCIIQDSIMDWEQESTRMHDVYRNAYLTVVAASGGSCHVGFLDLQPESLVRLHYKSSTSASSIGTYFLQERQDVDDQTVESQWNQRGWTFQEQKYSSRTLFFTAHDFAYWCPRGVISTQYPEKQNGISSSAHSSIFDDPWFRDIQKDPTNSQYSTDFFACWIENVKSYSRRKLTNPKDQLPALSALAKLFSISARGRYEYAAGLWTEDLHLGLLWTCSDIPLDYNLTDRLRHATGSDFVAPSWSWASQLQSVEWELGGETCAVHVMEPVVGVDGLNPYGRLKYGSLRVLGQVRAIPDISLEEKSHPIVCGVNGNPKLKIWLDWMEHDFDVMDKGQQISCTAITSLSMLLLVRYNEEDNYIYNEHDRHEQHEVGLLLHSSGESGVYFRVGVFDFTSDLNAEALFDGCEDNVLLL